MPKQVDHEERRRHIAAALLRIVVTRGLEAVSLRDVAAEAGVSMGAVQHYFGSKDDMLRLALEHNHEQLVERAHKLFADAPPPVNVRAALRLVVLELLPLSEERGAGARLAAAVLARGAVDPQVAATVRMSYADSLDFLIHHLRMAQERNELAAELDLDHAARSLYALIDGLRWAALFNAYTQDEVLLILDDHLARLFT